MFHAGSPLISTPHSCQVKTWKKVEKAFPFSLKKPPGDANNLKKMYPNLSNLHKNAKSIWHQHNQHSGLLL